MKTAAAATLGCRLNQADTALIYSRLRDAGFSVAETSKSHKPVESPHPDVVVLNTCTVTSNAARKSRQLARKLRKQYPDACIVVTGCDCVTNQSDWMDEPSVDLVVTNDMKHDISELVTSFLEKRIVPPVANIAEKEISNEKDEETRKVFTEDSLANFPFTTKAYLKIQEGCDAFCTYCIVPHVRGRERSRARVEILKEAEKLIANGHRELVVTGVNISTYDDEGVRIAELVSQLTDLPGDFRIRLSSMEPHEENRKLISLIKGNPKICRFLHVPLQHGADAILKSMGRPEESAKFADFIREAANEVPGIHLGTDIIVGFPGETDALFEASYKLLSKLPLANIHVFTFSAREGTPAATFPDQISKKVAKGRARRLKDLSDELTAKFADSQKGETLDILLEKKLTDFMFEGWSDNYLRATVAAPDASTGEIVKWKM